MGPCHWRCDLNVKSSWQSWKVWQNAAAYCSRPTETLKCDLISRSCEAQDWAGWVKKCIEKSLESTHKCYWAQHGLLLLAACLEAELYILGPSSVTWKELLTTELKSFTACCIALHDQQKILWGIKVGWRGKKLHKVSWVDPELLLNTARTLVYWDQVVNSWRWSWQVLQYAALHSMTNRNETSSQDLMWNQTRVETQKAAQKSQSDPELPLNTAWTVLLLLDTSFCISRWPTHDAGFSFPQKIVCESSRSELIDTVLTMCWVRRVTECYSLLATAAAVTNSGYFQWH